MALRQQRQGIGNSRQQLHLLVGNRFREACDAAMFFLGDRCVGKLFEAADERLPKALEAIAMLCHRLTFNGVQVLPHLFRSMDAMIQVRDKG